MRKPDLTYLVEPETGTPLGLEQAEIWADQEVVGGRLRGERGSFSIRQGIPCFVRAEVAEKQTVRSFGQKWARHHYYREHTSRFYTDWYLQRYGFFEPQGLRRFLEGAKFVLDAGCGAGRDAVNLAESSEAHVFAVDTSFEALEIAAKNIRHERISFVQADLHELPFKDGFFDVINCDQVIHHTPDPRAAFAALARKLRGGGRICTYVYRKKAPLREFADDHVRSQISALPADQALQVCEGITKFGQLLASLKLEINIEEDIPALGIQRGSIDLQRFFHWNIFKCFWNDEFDFFTNNIINFDWYHPEYCHRFEPQEFAEWFAEGWEIEAWDVQEAGMSCRARKL